MCLFRKVKYVCEHVELVPSEANLCPQHQVHEFGRSSCGNNPNPTEETVNLDANVAEESVNLPCFEPGLYHCYALHHSILDLSNAQSLSMFSRNGKKMFETPVVPGAGRRLTQPDAELLNSIYYDLPIRDTEAYTPFISSVKLLRMRLSNIGETLENARARLESDDNALDWISKTDLQAQFRHANQYETISAREISEVANAVDRYVAVIQTLRSEGGREPTEKAYDRWDMAKEWIQQVLELRLAPNFWAAEIQNHNDEMERAARIFFGHERPNGTFPGGEGYVGKDRFAAEGRMAYQEGDGEGSEED